MEPLPATAEAIGLLVASGDEGVRTRVAWLCETVVEAVPHADLVALWFPDEDLTLVHAVPSIGPALRSEDGARGSSLVLEVASGPRVTVVITLYSRRVDAFVGRGEVVERVLGAVPGTARLDEDLDLGCVRRADLAPEQLRSRLLVDTALGMLMGTGGLSIDEAEDWLQDVARTSGRTVSAVATQLAGERGALLDRADLDRFAEGGSVVGDEPPPHNRRQHP